MYDRWFRYLWLMTPTSYYLKQQVFFDDIVWQSRRIITIFFQELTVRAVYTLIFLVIAYV